MANARVDQLVRETGLLETSTAHARVNQLVREAVIQITNPCVVSYGQMVTDLSLRLSDPNLIFWTKAELQFYIIEALRTWNALTEIWIAPFSFSSTAAQVWYDISQAVGSPRQRTVLDTDLYKIMQYHLLEPASGGTWTGSSQFTISDLQGAVQRRQDELIQMTACNIAQYLVGANANTVRVTYPNQVTELVRARFIPNSGNPITLTREDTQAFDHFNPGHLQQGANPQSYSVVAEPPFATDFDTPPTAAGNLEFIAVNGGNTFNPPSSTPLSVPNDWTWLVKWGALADLLSRDSEATDRLRADYCFKRYLEGIKIMQASNWLISATIGGVPVDTPSMRELDAYSNEWENDPNAWPGVVAAGIDLVAAVPVAASSVVVNVVGNAPLPTLDADCVSVLRDHYDPMLDYAQVLASFKLGGAEFGAVGDLEKKFFQAALEQNRRLNALGIFTDVLHSEGKRQVITQPRFEG